MPAGERIGEKQCFQVKNLNLMKLNGFFSQLNDVRKNKEDLSHFQIWGVGFFVQDEFSDREQSKINFESESRKSRYYINTFETHLLPIAVEMYTRVYKSQQDNASI